jgi:hypothetical protein
MRPDFTTTLREVLEVLISRVLARSAALVSRWPDVVD